MKARAAAALSALLTLGACDLIFEGFPPPPPTPVATPERPRIAPEPSARSKALAAYYAEVQSNLLSQGLMRRDSGSLDAPFDARELAQDFIRIALYEEYTQVGDKLVPHAHPATLRRWNQPIRMEVVFGATVPPDQRRRILDEIQAYTHRLSRLTGQPITFGSGHPNFHVLVLDEDERLASGPLLRRMEPGLSQVAVRSITQMPVSTFCLVHAFSSSGSTSEFTAAIAVIRAEHPALLRTSCIHEELAQGMGLANDSPSARPSIFNDDNEFALLTPHDELLLRMLYDPRLHIGMREAQAAPVARQIAAEYLDGRG